MAKKPEPTFNSPLNGKEVTFALNWYNSNRTANDARKYLHSYAKLNIDSKLTVSDISKWNYVETDCWVSRLLSLEITFPYHAVKEKHDRRLRSLMNDSILEEKNQAEKKRERVVVPKKRNQIVKEGIVGHLEFEVDEFINANCKNNFDPRKYLSAHNVMRKDCTDIKRWAKLNYSHMAEVIVPKPDKQLKEGYSNFTKPQLKRLHSFYVDIYQAADKYMRAKVKKRVKKSKGSVTQTNLEAHLTTL